MPCVTHRRYEVLVVSPKPGRRKAEQIGSPAHSASHAFPAIAFDMLVPG
jgi:hypothetical protein